MTACNPCSSGVSIDCDDDTLVVTDCVGIPGPAGPQGEPGPQGPPGPSGAGLAYYIHTQTTPSASWVINHNLGRPLHVTVFIGTEIVEADVVEGTMNQASITWPLPVAGSAYLS